MAEFPALPLFTDAYLSDTRHLSTEEHGAYLLLMMEAWRRPDCSLPDDEELLARLAGLALDRWRAIADTILAFWQRDGRKKVWTQKRLSKEREYVSQKRASQQGNAAKRWNKTKNNDATAMPTACQNDAPTPTPSIKEDTSVSSKNPVGFEELSAVLDAERARAVIEHRKKIRKPLTAHAAKLLAGKFAQTAHPNLAADHMIANGWQGFEAEWASKLQPARHMRRGQYRIMRNGEVQHRNNEDDDWNQVDTPVDAVASIALHDYRRPLEAVG